ncbi:hypothetical protein TNIN_228011 [Trichonephila inaurata madagascariensis]|uniref:DUF4219 domain-containing protein n=1 Tax=Trichonephila inaurata madagascariensis TaxID=2747483 RepID=A0A8X6YIE2_9ARAC|nr:hypothetical protein TNIN_228011 [Trichonephila inaurata madagascariensis]
MANYSIPKLEDQNYVSWANDVKYLLMERQVWNIVAEIEIVPKRIVERIDDPVEAWKVLKTYYQPDSKALHMEISAASNRLHSPNHPSIRRCEVCKDVTELVAEEARLKLRNMDMNKEIAAQSTRMEPKKRSIKTLSVQESRSPEKQLSRANVETDYKEQFLQITETPFHS